MALLMDFETDSGVNVEAAYHKLFRFEVRTAGIRTIQIPKTDEDGNPVVDSDNNPVKMDLEVPNFTVEIQVCTYPDKDHADRDAPPIAARRFLLEQFDDADIAAVSASVGSITNTLTAISFMKGIFYRALKKLPEFADAADT